MDKERKIDLLLHDICARLPYGVMCHVRYIVNNETTDGDVWFEEDDKITRVSIDYREVFTDDTHDWHDIKNVKLYLRPLESMTEEERKYITDKCCIQALPMLGGQFSAMMPSIAAEWLIDFYNKNHFDYRGLIPAGHAIAVTEENNPYNKE